MRFPFREIHSFEDAQRDFEYLEQAFTPVWTGLAYAANYGDFGAPQQIGQWTKDGQGFIHLRGLVKKSVAWVAAETVATLPAGARPAATELFTCFADDATAGGFIATVQISNAGVVSIASVTVPTIGAPAALTWVSLAGITFQQGS